MAINGTALAGLAAGSIFLYAAIKGKSVLTTLQTIVQGKSPSTVSAANTISAFQPIAISSGSGPSGTTGTGGKNQVGLGPVSSPSALQAYAFSLFPSFGWGADQEQDLVKLWNQESGWNPTAQNPTSTAYGIAQFLDSTWGPYGPKTSNAQLQIKYGLEYIRDRYGNPAGAWAHEQANNWY